MHTMESLDAAAVECFADGSRIDRQAIMPQIGPTDRLGVVMSDGAAGLGAGTFILASVLAFYESLPDDRMDGITYPDFYTIQATADRADFRMLDVFPAHKNVAVEPDPDRLLEAIVDRAIDILLVPDVALTGEPVDETTKRSALRTVESCYVYAPDGRPASSEFDIRLPSEPVGEWFQTTIDSMDRPPVDDGPAFPGDAGWIRQGFRETDLESAVQALGAVGES